MGILKYSGFIICMIVFVVGSSGFKTVSNQTKTGEPKVEIWIDSIPTGPITVKQLLAAKIVRITSPEGLNYKVKSFVLIYMPGKGGVSSFINFVGNRLKGLSPSPIAKASVGDHIMVANAVIENLPKYMPEGKPMWTIVADSK